MSQHQAMGSEEIAELWRKRFGQPPPIIAEPELMLRILEGLPAAIEPEVRTWVKGA